MKNNTTYPTENLYNIIVAGGSIPPMISALEAILSGRETYAYIGRGRLYNGIDYTEKFHNMGFDETGIQALETAEVFDVTVKQIKEIRAADPQAFFNFYIDESRALKAAAIAANAGLTAEDFHVYMTEDGIDTYKKFAVFYGGKTGYRPVKAFLLKLTGREWFSSHMADFVADFCRPFISTENSILKKWFDNTVRKDFLKTVELSRARFAQIMSTQESSYSNPVFAPDYKTPFAVACMDNFTYMLQNRDKIDNIIRDTGNKKLMEIFSGTAGSGAVKPEIVSGNVNMRVKKLDEKQKEKYITLMFHRYLDEIKKNFSRSIRFDESAPEKKLIYVSSRFDTMFIRPVTDKKYGIGGMARGTHIPQSYAELDEKYKSMFLFEKEEDYNILLSAINDSFETENVPEETVMQAQAKVFNLYADYVFVAKLLYHLYGKEYDIAVKNHPRTDLGTSAEWADSYKIKYNDEKYLDSGKCLDRALTDFFRKDSTGRYIGVLSGSLSTENFEYLDSEVYFGGQPSSVYNGLSEEANIMFIITDSDGAVAGGGNTHFDYSAVSGLYKSGLLNYKDENGVKYDAVFYNAGNTLKACAETAHRAGRNNTADFYDSLFENWLKQTRPAAKDIDLQGFDIK